MKNTIISEVLFGTVTPPGGITCGCITCGGVIVKGCSMIEVQILNDTKVYTLGSSEKFTCCGMEKKVSKLFDSADDAERHIQSLEEEMRKNGYVDILLVEWATVRPVLN